MRAPARPLSRGRVPIFACRGEPLILALAFGDVTHEIRRLEHCEPFITLDGSEIRELAGVPSGNAANQSLAQATVPPGAPHRGALPPQHPRRSTCSPPAPVACSSARIRRRCSAGDCVVIAPGTAHQLVNDGAEPLVLLCCCSPPYSDADTVILPPSV